MKILHTEEYYGPYSKNGKWYVDTLEFNVSGPFDSKEEAEEWIKRYIQWSIAMDEN